MWFLFLVIYTTTFLMINPKKNENEKYVKKYKNFSIRLPRFKKKGQKKNIPSLEALERQALSRLKTYITPLPLLLQLQKKEQLIIFCVIKDKKNPLWKSFPLV